MTAFFQEDFPGSPGETALVFDPRAADSVSDALTLIDALHELPHDSEAIDSGVVDRTLATAERAVDASFVTRISLASDEDGAARAKRIALSSAETTGGWSLAAQKAADSAEEERRNANAPTRIVLPDELAEAVRWGKDAPADSRWKPTDRTIVKEAGEHIVFEPDEAIIAKQALENLAAKPLPGIDNTDEAAEVKIAQDVLNECFDEHVPAIIKAPRPVSIPDIPGLTQEKTHRSPLRTAARLVAVGSMALLAGSRRR